MNNMPPNGTRRDIGVAIALRQQQHQQHQQHNAASDEETRMLPHCTTREKRSVTGTQQNMRQKKKHRKATRLWWQDLLFGLSVYLVCIYLPSMYRVFQHVYSEHWCPFVLSFITKKLIGSGDAAWSDLVIVVVLSTSLAILRIAVVQWLVDMQSPANVQAMVRCKSIHLLSSAYPQSLTPTNLKRGIQPSCVNNLLLETAPFLPDLSGVKPMAPPPEITPATSPLQPRPIARSDSWLERNFQSTWDSVRNSSALATDARLHAAPRYATALFRCLYGMVAVSTAWFGFSSANFWPAAVGGTGNTKNCWNLKGSPGMEEDFDELNALLKFYYLLQGSYHLHSGAFHVLTMIILWARHRRGKNKGTSSKPFTSYWRSLLQHVIALALIGGSHLFASTRRLGAIGSFALDVSSLVLHLLQVCINAPQTIPRHYVKAFHRGIVIPIFCYCRFYVWPFCVWKSAWLESKDWLQQMESTMFPGIYDAMIWLFTLLTVVLLGLNVVLLKRLVNHPHLQRVYNTNP